MPPSAASLTHPAEPAPLHQGAPHATPDQSSPEFHSEVDARPVEHAPAPRAEPQPSLVTAPVHEPSVPRNAPELPRISLDLPPESGLVLVETSHERPSVSAGEEAEASRPRRVRPARAEVRDEPLQMVETTHKDSTPPAE